MPDYRIAVGGGRDFQDYGRLKYDLSDFIVRLHEGAEDDHPGEKVGITIVSGGASGADSLAKRYAKEFLCDYVEFLPDWTTHGRAAGFIRNQLIVDAATHLLAFWDGQSKGTTHSIALAKKKGIPVEIHSYGYPNDRL